MLLVIWLHLWRDMAQHKARTLLAVLLAVPSAALCARWMGKWMLDLALNITTIGAFRVSLVTALAQIATGSIIPVLAALVLVIGGVRISPRQAISRHGLGGSSKRGLLDDAIERVCGLPFLLALSLRNTFRRKERISLTWLRSPLSARRS